MDSDMESLPSPPGPPKEPPPSLPPPLPARPRKTSPQPPIPTQPHYDIDQEVDNDDEISAQMTASYSEISFKSGGGQSPEGEIPPPLPLTDNARRPATLACERRPFGPLNLEGSVHVEGNMTHFVAEDLEYKIKLSSPQAKRCETPPIPGASSSSRSCTPSTLYRQLLVPHMGQIDSRLLNDLECEAQRIATSIDNLTENLCGILHSISSITADNVDVYKNAVSKMSDAMDANIKSMYTMMAKAEEVTQAMKLVQVHATRLKEIRRLVDLFDSCV